MPKWMGEELPRPSPHDVTENARNAMREVEKCLNTFDPKSAYHLAHLLASNHRTLVQNAMRDLVIPFILYLAEDSDDARYDLRNQGSTELAHTLAQTIRSESISLPVV